MGKFDGVLLASDFDNTILNTERPRRTGCPIPPISQRNVEALRYFMDNGGRFAVATGRALPAFRMFAEQVPMNAPAVVCNGGALYDFKTERYLETMELPETTSASSASQASSESASNNFVSRASKSLFRTCSFTA